MILVAGATGELGSEITRQLRARGEPVRPLVRAKRSVQDRLARSGLAYTVLQASLFMESWLGPMLFADPAQGTAKYYGDGTRVLSYVAMRDVAEMVVRCVRNPAARNRTIQ